ncbi:MAG: barstar family protein [Candidatus Gracilibacteria bacterium]|nr:barstar family protein [Candidatus Gracilibacteria bacterium]
MSILNFSHIHTKSELMDTLEVFFGLPNFWGRNWDAFGDCIADREFSTLPSQVQIIGLETLRKNFGEDAQILEEILDENSIKYTLLR